MSSISLLIMGDIWTSYSTLSGVLTQVKITFATVCFSETFILCGLEGYTTIRQWSWKVILVLFSSLIPFFSWAINWNKIWALRWIKRRSLCLEIVFPQVQTKKKGSLLHTFASSNPAINGLFFTYLFYIDIFLRLLACDCHDSADFVMYCRMFLQTSFLVSQHISSYSTQSEVVLSTFTLLSAYFTFYARRPQREKSIF